MSVSPLTDVRVLDLTRLLPGPFCTLWLADLGADVIKVEDTGGGDWVRALPPAVDDSGGAVFHALNRSKRSVSIDLKHEDGRAVLLELARSADVLVESFRPGVLDRLGIGFETLTGVNEKLIVASITGFGQTGPFRDRAGHDIGYAAIGGVLGVTGTKDGPPVIPGIPLADHLGAIVGVTSILSALLERAKTGKGRHLDISLTDSAHAVMLLHLAPHLVAGGDPPLRGDVSLTGAEPNYAVYKTSDGRFLAVGSLEPKFWSRLCKAIGREDLEGEVLAMQLDRSRRPAVAATLTEIFASKTLSEWTELLADADACVEPIPEGEEILAHPNNVARDMTFEYEIPGAGTARGLRAPLKPWAWDATTVRPAPKLGEHTDEVLQEAGIEATRIATLREQGALR